ncbi:Secretin ExeD [Methylophilaceae bacterium]|nr:Secretin ExeD [Methylophilaceae bacterium]
MLLETASVLMMLARLLPPASAAEQTQLPALNNAALVQQKPVPMAHKVALQDAPPEPAHKNIDEPRKLVAEEARNAPEEQKPPVVAIPQRATQDKTVPASHKIRIQKLEFKKAKLIDVMRTISEISDINIVPTKSAGEVEVTIYLRNISVHDAIDTISKSNGLWYRQDKVTEAYRVMTTQEFQNDIVVFRDDITQVFNLLHPNPVIVAQAIKDIYGTRVILSLGIEADDFSRGSTAGGARSGQSSLRRQTGRNANASRTSSAGGGGGGQNRVSDQVVTEKLTPEQLARIGEALTAAADGESVSSDLLKGVSRTEQPIYITVNREHNLIIARSSDAAVLRDIDRLIKDMDRPTPQVLLEMKILEVTIGDSFSQLFNFQYLSSSGKGFVGLGNVAAGTGSTFIYDFLDSRISARIELLEKNNQVNTLSSPILLASNNRPARVFVGEERILVTGVTVTDPVISAVGTVITPGRITYETELRDIGNTLNIVPKINADGTVTLSIQQDVSVVLEGAISLPPITVGNTTQSFNIDSVKVANIEGIVVAKDGLTVAIGGLISANKVYNESKVPLLGDVPIVGELFKQKQESQTKTELLLLIKPHIIKSPGQAEGVTMDRMDEISMQDTEAVRYDNQ